MDANVLINLIHVDRLDLLGGLSEFEFLVPEQVVVEISHPEHAQSLEIALEEGHVRSISTTDLDEIRAYSELREVMGKGEAACLAIAHARGWLVASDERGRFLRYLRERLGDGQVLNTPGLILLAIQEALLDVDQADDLKKTLENHRFKMKFASFRDLLENQELYQERTVSWPTRIDVMLFAGMTGGSFRSRVRAEQVRSTTLKGKPKPQPRSMSRTRGAEKFGFTIETVESVIRTPSHPVAIQALRGTESTDDRERDRELESDTPL